MKIVENFDELVETLAEIGINEGDSLHIMTPQFERLEKLEINFIPKVQKEFDFITSSTPEEVLKKMGVGVWDRLDDGTTVYLFPGKWYDSIPEGYEVVGLNNEVSKFSKATHSNDIMYGCLAYGFKVNWDGYNEQIYGEQK